MTSENGGFVEMGGNAMTLLDKTGKSRTVGGFAFDGLFLNCVNLASVAANLLPATNLASYCYSEMFEGCTALTGAPKLPAENLTEGCYSGMFRDCTALATAPELPVKTLTDFCYQQMFSGCTALTAAPELPATTLATSCYAKMFNGCEKLSSVTVGFTSWLDGATLNWLQGVAAKGTFLCPPELAVERGESNIPNGWLVNPVKIAIGSLPAGIAEVTIENKTAGSGWVKTADGYLVSTNDTFQLTYVASPGYVLDFTKSGDTTAEKAVTTVGTDESADLKFPGAVLPDYLSMTATGGDVLLQMPAELEANIEVCAGTPHGTWTPLGSEATTNIAEGTTLYLRTASDTVLAQVASQANFVMTSENGGLVEMGGNAMTLLDKKGKSRTVGENAFDKLFQGCTNLVSVAADLLPAMNLAASCYDAMFFGCTSLTNAPAALPATNLAKRCYAQMFGGCKALTVAPELPAETLAENCYNGMFNGCWALTAAPALPATNLAVACYWGMLSGCASLTAAPELPATTLTNGCYNSMFSSSTNISSVTVGFTNWTSAAGQECTEYWLVRVAPTGTFFCPPALPIERGESRIPNGWLVNPVKIQIGSLPTGIAEVQIENKTAGSGCVETEGGYLVSTNDTFQLTYVASPGYVLDFTTSGDTTAEKAVTTVGTDESADLKFPGAVLPDYLSFTAVGGDVLLTMPAGLKTNVEVRASESDPWATLGASESTNILAGATIYMRTASKELPVRDAFTHSFGTFKMSSENGGLVEVGGNAMTLLDQTSRLRVVYEVALSGLFASCSNLVSVGADLLPATNLSTSCYEGMFENCTSLTNAPALPAEELGASCYDKMFFGCTSLVEAPVLPAKDMEIYCYHSMFEGCTSLTEAPALEATNLAERCYAEMFHGCTALTDAPALTATNLAQRCYEFMFSGCTALTNAPALPAKTLTNGCYYCMFGSCTALTVAPELPATTLNELCYCSMFSGCKALTAAPALPATTLVTGCYDGMFSYCEALTNAPTLAAENLNLATNCYAGMFQCCKALTAAPELPAMTLAKGCYRSMFAQCMSLTNAPALPATTLAEGCYDNMFELCLDLKKAPRLPATTLVKGCYDNMFNMCRLLCEVTADFTNWTDAAGNDCTKNWLQDVAATGTFFCPPELAIERGESRIPNGWLVNPVKIDRSGIVLGEGITGYAITNLTDGSTIVTNADGSLTVSTNDTIRFVFETVDPERYVAHPSSIEVTASEAVNYVVEEVKSVKRPNYLRFHALETNTGVLTIRMPEDVEVSTDTDPYGDWAAIAKNGTTNLAAGAALYIRRKAEGEAESVGGQFGVEGAAGDFFEATGSAMTLLDKTDESRTVGENAFRNLFGDCINLTSVAADLLPATNLMAGCYSNMFWGCKALTVAPELPAAELAASCYESMFYGCTSLTVAPELSAETLAEGCYESMFEDCTMLTAEPALPAKTLVKSCYDSMFCGCASLTNAPALPATTLAEGCYSQMFSGCTALTNAPALPATTLAEGCYSQMFSGCAALETAPALPAVELAEGCYEAMFSGCTALTNAPALPATTLAVRCYKSMFYGCTSLTDAPELPAEVLSEMSYGQMFENCTSLTNVPRLAVQEFDTASADGMFRYAEKLNALTVEFDSWPNGSTGGWLDGVAETGVFTCPIELPVIKDENHIPVDWNVKKRFTLPGPTGVGSYVVSNALGEVVEPIGTVPGGNLYEVPVAGEDDTISIYVQPAEGYVVHGQNPLTVNLTEGGEMGTLPGSTRDYLHFTSPWPASKPEDFVIADGVLTYYGGLNAVVAIPEGVTAIGERAFFDMKWVERVYVPKSVKSIAPLAFATCGALKAVLFEQGSELESIKPSAFAGAGITSIAVPDSVKTIGSGAFNGCTALTEVWLGNGLEEIAEDAFYDPLFGMPEEGLPIEVVYVPTGKGEAYKAMLCEELRGLVVETDEPAPVFKCALTCTTDADEPLPLEWTDDPVGGTWADVEYDVELPLVVGKTIFLRKKGDGVALSANGLQIKFSGDAFVEAHGNAMSLLDQTCQSVTVGEMGLSMLFADCVQLVSAPEISATNLDEMCYAEMFAGCTALTNAPALPAEKLAYGCYSSMFDGCTALETAPALPATELAEGCYYGMFAGCEALEEAPALDATTLAPNCYMGMFNRCTALTVAPELPATTLANDCYKGMFYGCTNLSSVTVGFTNWRYGATDSWLSDVAAKGEFFCPPELAANTPVADRGGSTIPVGWLVNPKVLTVEPIDPNLTMVVTNVTEGCETELVELDGDLYRISSNATVEVRFAAKEGWELVDGPLSTDGVVTYDPFVADTTLAAADQPHAVKLFEITVLNVVSGLCFSVTNDLRGDLTGVVNGPTNEVKAAAVSNTTSVVVFKPMAGFKFLNQPKGTQEVSHEFAEICSNVTFDALIDELAVTNAFLLTIPKTPNMSVSVTVGGQPMVLTEGDDAWTCSIDSDAVGDVVVTFTPAEGYLLDDPSKGTITRPVSSISGDVTIKPEEMPVSRIIVAYVTVGEGAETPAWNATNVIHTLTNTPNDVVTVRYTDASADIDTMPADAPFAFAAGAQFSMDPVLRTLTVAGDELAVTAPLTADVNYDIADNLTIKADLLCGAADAVVQLRGDLTVASGFTVGAGEGAGAVLLSVAGAVTCEGGAKIALAKNGSVKAKATYEDDIVRAADAELRGYRIVKTPQEENYVLFSLDYVGVAIFEIEGELPLYVNDGDLAEVWDQIAALTELDPYLLITLEFLEDTSWNGFEVPNGARLYFAGRSVEVDLPEGTEFTEPNDVTAGRDLVVFGDQAKVKFSGKILAQADVTDWTENTYVDFSYVRSVRLLGDVTVGVTNEQAVTAMNGVAELWLPYFYNQEQITLEDDTARIKVTKFGRVLSPLPRVELNNLVGLAGDLILPADGDDYEIHCEYDEYLERYVYTERLKGSFEVKEVGDDGVTLKYICMTGTTAEEVLALAVIGCPDEKAFKTMSWTRSQAAYAAMFDLSATENPDGLGWLVTATLKPEVVAAVRAALNEAAEGIMTDVMTRQTGKVYVKTVPGLCYTVYAAPDAASENFAPDGPTAYGDGEGKWLTFTAKPAKGRCFKVKAEFKTPTPPHNNH